MALAAAKALEALGEMPTACLAEVSGNAIKNAESFGKKETWVRVTYYRAKVRLLERLGDDNE